QPVLLDYIIQNKIQICSGRSAIPCDEELRRSAGNSIIRAWKKRSEKSVIDFRWGFRKDHFVAAGHLNEPEEAKAARHARMPSPFGALRQSVILRAVQITLRNLCAVESLELWCLLSVKLARIQSRLTLGGSRDGGRAPSDICDPTPKWEYR